MYKLLHTGRVFVLFLCLIFVICSCQTTERNFSIPSIEADVTSNNELKLSEYFENFRMLQLPTDTIMGVIEKIKYENNRIYISDRQTMFIFSDEGELLSCFQKKGVGPGEYRRISDFKVDGENIIVLDRDQQRLLTFNYAGECISTRNLGQYVQSVSPTVDYSFFLYFGTAYSHKLQRVSNGQEDSLYLVTDMNQAKYLFAFSWYNFCRYQNLIYFFEPYNDIVYESIGGSSITPSFRVDFMGKNIPAAFFEEQYHDIMEFSQKVEAYAFGVFNFAAYDRFLMFVCRYLNNMKLTVFDRKDTVSKTFATIKDDVYFNGSTIPVSEFVFHANKHIFVPIDAFKVVEWRQEHPSSEQYKGIVSDVKEDDNPILLIFDFKQ